MVRNILWCFCLLACTGKSRKDVHTPQPDEPAVEQPTTPEDKDQTTKTIPQTPEELCKAEQKAWRQGQCLSLDEAIATECAKTPNGVFIPATAERPAYCRHPAPTDEERCLSSGYQYEWRQDSCQFKNFLAWCQDEGAPIGAQNTVRALLWSIDMPPAQRNCQEAADKLRNRTALDLSLESLAKKDPTNNPPLSDLEPLRILKDTIQTLNLRGHHIEELDALEGFTALQTLNVADNKISQLEWLTTLTQLKRLFIQNNTLTSTAGVSSLAQLEELDLSKNKIVDLGDFTSPKHGWAYLRVLHLEHNAIHNPAPLEAISRLTHIYLGHNKVHNLDFVKVLTHLKVLHLEENPLTPENLATIELLKQERVGLTIEI